MHAQKTTSNPNNVQSPLGYCLYHLGIVQVKQMNRYQSCHGREIRRKMQRHEAAAGLTIPRAQQLFVFGKRVDFCMSDMDRLFDVIHLAWTSKMIGTGFTLRVMQSLLESKAFDKKKTQYAYCEGLFLCIKKRSKRNTFWISA